MASNGSFEFSSRRTMRIGDSDVTSTGQPYLIAEIGVNHFDIAEQRGIPPIEAAKEMVTDASTAGVDAVKFQSYTADTLASKQSPAYWDTDQETTESQYELFKKYDGFDAGEFEIIAQWIADNLEIDFLSTPFDFDSVEYLDELVPAYKVASADITNHPLLRVIAQKNKPILLSTGASTIGEIEEALHVIHVQNPNVDVCLLHCILQYPTDEVNANIGMIEHLANVFPNHEIGYSDHVPPDDGMVTLLNATIKGATVIEKHFTLDKSLEGNDHYHAMDPNDVKTFLENYQRLETTTGIFHKSPIDVEEDSRRHARRSLVAARDIKQGENITRDLIEIKRPGTGISPVDLNIVLGRKATRSIGEDEIIEWDMV